MKLHSLRNNLFRKTLVCASVGLVFGTAANAQDMSAQSIQAKSEAVAVEKNKVQARGVQMKADFGRKTYIVQLKAPAVASYKGGIEGFAATSIKVTGASKLDVNAKASKTYAAFLDKEQRSLIAHCESAFGRNINVKYTYSHAFNGVAMELTAEEAAAMANLPEVVNIAEQRFEKPDTDNGPKWIGAPYIWENNDANSEAEGSMGEGMVIAVLDTGINHDHPSFADVGSDGYDHDNPLGSGNYVPGSYCDVTDPTFCNDKLIGAWDMVQSAADPGAPEDSDGHGSHTASTAAGNFVDSATIYGPTTEFTRDISGVAPHANIIAYDVCIDTCPGAALLAAVEQVVIDAGNLPGGIQALNYSISGGNSPYSDAVELGFLNATEAGIYVAASAGNSGPGAQTTGHNSPWVSTTAAMTHDRAVSNTLVDMTSEESGPLDDLQGSGVTAPYGPAPIVYAGDFPTENGSSNDSEPEQCLEPFPPGTFDGEIVICDRGTIARVGKGQNVLAGGAGGFVLANAEGNGESTVNDFHFLPGIHLGFTDGEVLKGWVAASPDAMGTIAGFTSGRDKSVGDIVAGFSSRGPNSSIDIIKPDIGGPGVDIMAAVSSSSEGDPAEFGFISGTSMSSPHNAGAGALVNGMTDWTPYEVKSAIMMTSKTKKLFKDDGVTPADPFDVGAGRIDLKRVLKSGLVLNETAENFLAANPALGGDPRTLNIASMQDGNCVGSCSWTRTVTNKGEVAGRWKLKAKSDDMKVSVSPTFISLLPGESAEVTVTADTSSSGDGWLFGSLILDSRIRDYVDLHMPIAAQGGLSTSANLTKTVDLPVAVEGDILNYEVRVFDTNNAGVITLTDMMPDGVTLIEESVSAVLENGDEVSPVSTSGNMIDWSFMLDTGETSLVASPAPFGYFSLASLGVAPAGCPSNCDDGGFIFNNLPEFQYQGNSFTSLIMSINGTIQAGTDTLSAASFINGPLPNPSTPNNVMAPFWTDLNMTDQGNWYLATLNAGPVQYIVAEWENVPLWGTSNGQTFQVWIEAGTSNIWFVYESVQDFFFATVGFENSDGSDGDMTYFDGDGVPPTPGVDMFIESAPGGSATLQFQGEITRCRKKAERTKLNQVDMQSDAGMDKAIAVTACTRK